MNVLKRDWKEDMGLRHVLVIVRCLLIEPFPESALNEEAGKLLLENYEDFAKHARLMTSIHAQPAKRCALFLLATMPYPAGLQAMIGTACSGHVAPPQLKSSQHGPCSKKVKRMAADSKVMCLNPRCAPIAYSSMVLTLVHVLMGARCAGQCLSRPQGAPMLSTAKMRVRLTRAVQGMTARCQLSRSPRV